MLETLCAITVIAGTLLGGPQPEPPENAPLLSGPTVADTNVTGLASTFSTASQNEPGRMMGADPALFRRALFAMRQAPAELRPTTEQEAEIAKLLRAFHRSERAFRAKFGPELQRLRVALPGDHARNSTPPLGDPMMIDEPAEPADPAAQGDLALRAREIMAQRPNPAQLEKPVRALLTEPQRTWLDDKIAQLAKERFEQNAMERYRREAGDRLDAMDDRLKQALANLPPRIRKRIEALPPEQQAETPQRLRDRRDGQGTRPSPHGPPLPGADHLPPTVDEIDIPHPADGG